MLVVCSWPGSTTHGPVPLLTVNMHPLTWDELHITTPQPPDEQPSPTILHSHVVPSHQRTPLTPLLRLLPFAPCSAARLRTRRAHPSTTLLPAPLQTQQHQQPLTPQQPILHEQSVCVTLRIPYRVHMGQSVGVVGSAPELGAWDTSKVHATKVN